MEHVIVLGFIFIVSVIIAWKWVGAIDHMDKHHPSYKGEDFLNWDENKSDTEN
jgi:hypothetical protein